MNQPAWSSQNISNNSITQRLLSKNFSLDKINISSSTKKIGSAYLPMSMRKKEYGKSVRSLQQDLNPILKECKTLSEGFRNQQKQTVKSFCCSSPFLIHSFLISRAIKFSPNTWQRLNNS